MARPTILFWVAAIAIGALLGAYTPQHGGFPLGFTFVGVTLVVCGVILTTRTPGRLSWQQLMIVLGMVTAAMTVLMLRHEIDLLRLGATGFICFMASLLIPRGHPLIGSVLAVGVLAVSFWGSSVHPNAALPPERHLLQPLAGFLGCWILYAVSRAVASKRASTLDQELSAMFAADAAHIAHADERREALAIAQVVEPLLERIAAGEQVTADLRDEVARADQEARELIRRDLPRHEGLRLAVASARQRGVTVRMLGSGEAAAPDISGYLIERIIELFSRENIDRVTVRFLPGSRPVAATMLLQQGAQIERFEFGRDGALLNKPIRS